MADGGDSPGAVELQACYFRQDKTAVERLRRLPSLRGRGSSGGSPDHSPPRFQEDIDAFVDSVGEPVLLVGWSDGANLALGAAARSGGVAAVAAYEPGVYTLMREDDFARFGSAIKQQMEAGGYPKLRRPLTNQAEGRSRYSYPRPMKAAPLKPEGFPVPPHG